MGKRHPHAVPVPERMARTLWRIYNGGEVTMAWMRERFGISKQTAGRDLTAIMRAIPGKQTGAGTKGVVRRVSLAKREVKHLFDHEVKRSRS